MTGPVRILVPAAAVLLALAGCGPAGGRWLETFFDEPPRPSTTPVAATAAPADTLTTVGGAPVSGRSTHAPSEAGACGACHDLGASTSFPGGGGWPGREPTEIRLPRTSGSNAARLRLPLDHLCAACHGDLEGETLARNHAVVHAPVASGGCTFCHDPHRSPYPKLLKSPDGRTLCGRCHDPAVSSRVCPHPDSVGRDCLECHLPHAAEKRGLLREDTP